MAGPPAVLFEVSDSVLWDGTAHGIVTAVTERYVVVRWRDVWDRLGRGCVCNAEIVYYADTPEFLRITSGLPGGAKAE